MIRAQAIDRQAWDVFVASRPEANFLQSWQWGELHQLLGDTTIRVGLYQDDTLVGVWQGIVKNARRGRYLEVPGGPLLDWTNDDVVREATASIRGAARQEACVFARIRPQVEAGALSLAQLAAWGYRTAPMHLHAEHTSILELTKNEADILAAMRRQTRYEVRRATKQDITVTATSGPDAIDEFVAVQADTARRQGFVPSSKPFLTALARAFGKDVRVYRASKDGQLLNLALVIYSGAEADYYEAASTPQSRAYAGAYALQWQSIRDAQQAGKSRYNFWGIAYNDDPRHRYAGVTTFKRGFGGSDVTYVPAQDLVIHPLGYLKNWLIETVRRKKRKL